MSILAIRSSIVSAIFYRLRLCFWTSFFGEYSFDTSRLPAWGGWCSTILSEQKQDPLWSTWWCSQSVCLARKDCTWTWGGMSARLRSSCFRRRTCPSSLRTWIICRASSHPECNQHCSFAGWCPVIDWGQFCVPARFVLRMLDD